MAAAPCRVRAPHHHTFVHSAAWGSALCRFPPQTALSGPHSSAATLRRCATGGQKRSGKNAADFRSGVSSITAPQAARASAHKRRRTRASWCNAPALRHARPRRHRNPRRSRTVAAPRGQHGLCHPGMTLRQPARNAVRALTARRAVLPLRAFGLRKALPRLFLARLLSVSPREPTRV